MSRWTKRPASIQGATFKAVRPVICVAVRSIDRVGNNSVRAALGYLFLLQANFGLGSMGFFVKREQAALWSRL
jgi:hypothetical protein